MRAIIRFSKGENAKYISHLDIQRAFQRALRRAGLPVSYSQGYNPHILLSFACPLPVGVCSRSEFLELWLDDELEAHDVLSRIASAMPEGLEVTAITVPSQDFPALGGLVTAAEYSITVTGDMGDAVERFLAQTQILTEKKSKKGIVMEDIRPLIQNMSVCDGRICALVAAGNATLRADRLCAALSEFFEKNSIKCEIENICRKKIFITYNGVFSQAPAEIEI